MIVIIGLPPIMKNPLKIPIGRTRSGDESGGGTGTTGASSLMLFGAQKVGQQVAYNIMVVEVREYCVWVSWTEPGKEQREPIFLWKV